MFWFKTRAGMMRIIRDSRGWMLWLDDDCFDGPFPTAQQACDQLTGGHTPWVAGGDPSLLGCPDSIEDWCR